MGFLLERSLLGFISFDRILVGFVDENAIIFFFDKKQRKRCNEKGRKLPQRDNLEVEGRENPPQALYNQSFPILYNQMKTNYKKTSRRM